MNGQTQVVPDPKPGGLYRLHISSKAPANSKRRKRTKEGKRDKRAHAHVQGMLIHAYVYRKLYINVYYFSVFSFPCFLVLPKNRTSYILFFAEDMKRHMEGEEEKVENT